MQQEQETFVVEMINQQNGTWQGTITWIEGRKSLQFRSTLEMIRLMDSALGDPARPDGADTPDPKP